MNECMHEYVEKLCARMAEVRDLYEQDLNQVATVNAYSTVSLSMHHEHLGMLRALNLALDSSDESGTGSADAYYAVWCGRHGR